MVFIDWTFSGNGSGTLDASIKYAGLSSYKGELPTSFGLWNNQLTHNTFSAPQAQIIFWGRLSSSGPGEKRIRIRHSSYGYFDMEPLLDDTFHRFRVTFWYDAGTNIKWGRVERYISSAWVQYGTDTNLGSGSPPTGSITLEVNKGYIGATAVAVIGWFDELEVYS